jgi:hypothetical protein
VTGAAVADPGWPSRTNIQLAAKPAMRDFPITT